MLRPLFLLTAVSATSLFAQDPFAEGVRKTEPLTPEKQQAEFQLPPGFEIQLVAAEPDLRKPMNMAFDATGRLWVTESREYPFPAKGDAPRRDSVRIFSDFGPDGRARKMEIFADGLNIPIGLYPFRTGSTWKCIVWSIPNIWLMEDTDGDGKADKREVLFGPLGWERDTHGNQASFRRSPDGWLYGTHGYNNQSTFKAKDGSTISLTSGNTWRIRLDGERVEQHTWGQVNPFGLCWDDRGNLYSADCHSSPIYQLLKGGFYPSFGKPHDGLGFAPQTVLHSHGSTAICGPMMVQDKSWPAEFQGRMFVGNVMTSRLNQDEIQWTGASSKGKEMPDFLTSKDPWFRPVDVQWGPDGALYVADFYNRIIGHYEVPLLHPGRDRERGRLWRVVYKGQKAAAPLPEKIAIAQDLPGLVKELASENPTRRSLALNELTDRIGKDGIAPLKAAIAAPANGFQRVNAMWALWRFGALDEATLLAGIKDPDAMVRTHALRQFAQTPQVTEAGMHAVRAALHDPDGIVRRLAAEALGGHPAAENFEPLLDLLRKTPKADDHLIYGIRLALREQLRAPAVAAKISLEKASPDDLRALLDIMLAVPGEQTALLRFSLFEKIDVAAETIAKQLPSMVKNLPPERLPALIAMGRERLKGALDAQADVLQNLLEALDQRGLKPDQALTEWGEQIATVLLATKEGDTGWVNTTPDGSPTKDNIWGFQSRPSADGQTTPLMSSHFHGERNMGSLRSASFALPEKLRFFIVGHDGEPGTKAGKKNFVRLRAEADGKVLREAAPPRNDTAQRVEWDLKEFAGQRGYFEATDGDNGTAYAWLGFGRFKPELRELALVEPTVAAKRHQLAADLARVLRLKNLSPGLVTTFQNDLPDAALAAAKALVVVGAEGTNLAQLLGTRLHQAATPVAVREKLAPVLADLRTDDARRELLAGFTAAPARVQTALANALGGTKEGAAALLTAIGEGKVPAVVLRDKALADKLKVNVAGAVEQIAKLTANLPPANAAADKVIAARRAKFESTKSDVKRGEDAFTRNCAVCHQIGQKGNLVGPQLDGIGSRGLDRVLEDILDPSRNVDRAFRLSIVTLQDDSVIAGLFRREEGETLVFADLTGKEQSVPKAKIKTRTESDTSLMPPAFGEAIPEQEFCDLLAYLLSQKATK